jgi:SAM-dependent methyltransferase
VSGAPRRPQALLGWLALDVGWTRRLIWKLWYPLLTRRLRGEEVLFLNYAFEQDPPMGLALSAEDEPNRGCIQLYHHVASQADLRGKDVLEVSCGHGGGASYLARTFRPRSYTALDLNPAGIDFCRRRHRVEGLSFVRGDAENLPFEDGSFDGVVNVEASHCYPSFPRFLSEVARVLRPGGRFLYADFRFGDRLDEWDQAMAAAPLKVVATRQINAEVLRGMDMNSARSRDLIARFLPGFLQSLGRDFAGVSGSKTHRSLAQGEMTYRSYCLQKA